MMGVYSQLYLDSFGNLPPIVRALAAAADEMEMKLERLRIHCGFKEDWSPVHDRTMKSAAASMTDVSWAKRCGLLNGMGDLGAFLQEMCGWMDEMGEKLENVDHRLEVDHLVQHEDGSVSGPAIPPRAASATYIGEGSASLDAMVKPKRGPGRPRKDAA